MIIIKKQSIFLEYLRCVLGESGNDAGKGNKRGTEQNIIGGNDYEFK